MVMLHVYKEDRDGDEDGESIDVGYEKIKQNFREKNQSCVNFNNKDSKPLLRNVGRADRG